MLGLIALIISTFLGAIGLKRWLGRTLSADIQRHAILEKEFAALSRGKEELVAGVASEEKSLADTAALYETSKEMRKTLDEDKMFSIFSDALNKYIGPQDCRFIKGQRDLAADNGYDALPLTIGQTNGGYLLSKGIQGRDRDKYLILAGQFLSAMKGAYLFKQIQELTVTDSLTQIFNRGYFLERLTEERARSAKFNFKFSFLMVDIDNFKDFNDRYGHLAGDAILKDVAGAIKQGIRGIDFMGRYGGEELSIVLTQSEKNKAILVAERIRKMIQSRKIRIYGEELSVTVSIGVASFPEDAKDAKGIMEKADAALYAAKRQGRNQVCVTPPR
jgi:diguanylate cyclase (GGDEF)-like protein